jgi:hypothetical protein
MSFLVKLLNLTIKFASVKSALTNVLQMLLNAIWSNVLRATWLCIRKKPSWPQSASELYRSSDRRLSAKLLPTFSVVQSSEFLATDPEVLGSIPGTTRKKVVCLERGPLSLASTTVELLGRNNSGSGLENREYGRRDSSR